MVDPNGEYSEAWRVPLGAAGASSPPPVFGFENRRGRDPNRLGVTRQFLSADGGTGLGNYLLTVPILDVPGRGLDLRLNLYHNSNVWRGGQSANGPYLYFDYDKGFPAPGWSLGFGQFYIDGQGYYFLQDADGTLHRMAVRSGIWPEPGLHTIDGTLIDMPVVNGQFNAQYPDGRTVIYGAFNPVGGFFYPVEIADANGNVITIDYVNGAGPAIDEIHDTLGRVISFHYDANPLLTAITAPGLDGATRPVVRFHYAPLNLPAPSPDIVVSPAQGIDAVYFPGTSTGYWFGEGDSYTPDSGIIAKVSQRRVMALEAGPLNEQGTVWPGIVTHERLYEYLPFHPPDLPTYTAMTESWAGLTAPPAVTAYTVTPPNPYGSPWAIQTVRPDGTTVVQSLASKPNQWDDGLLTQTTTYESAGDSNPLRDAVTNWEQGDYDSPRVKAVEETDQLGLKRATAYDYLSPTNQVVAVSQSRTVGQQGQMAVFRTICTDYVTDPGYAKSHIFNLPKVVGVYDQDGPGGGWSGWASLAPGLPFTFDGEPVVARNADGRLEVFGLTFVDNVNTVGHVWETVPGGGWSAWAPLAPLADRIGEPVVGINADGRLQVFVWTIDFSLWTSTQTVPGGSVWSAWAPLAPPGVPINGAPVVARNADGRLQIFVCGNDFSLRTSTQTVPGGSVWSAWTSPAPGVQLGEPVVARNADGRLEVFALSGDTGVGHIWQTVPGGGWSAWTPLGPEGPAGPLSSPAPAVGINADGRLELFTRGTDNALWHIWQTIPGSSVWSAWAPLLAPPGVPISSDNPAAGINADGLLEVFAVGTDNALWHIWQTVPGGGWSAWASLGGQFGQYDNDPVVGVNADERLEVFAAFDDNRLWHIWQTAPGGGWSAWAPLGLGGPFTGDPAAGINADGRLQVFARGTDNGLWTMTQTVPGSVWSAWAPLGPGVPFTGDPAVGTNADGRLEVFARGTDGALWHIWQTAPGGGWSAWASLGGQFTGDPAVGINADGRLEVFARGTDGALWHIWQTAPGGPWTGWAPIAPGVPFDGDPAVGINADGRLEVFARGTDNGLWHIWQTAPGGPWTGWASLAPGSAIISDPAVGINADGRLEVFGRGTDNGLWHIWQTVPGGGWSAWAPLAPGVPVNGDPVVARNADGRLELFTRGTDGALWHVWQDAPAGSWTGWASLGAPFTGGQFSGDPVVEINADGRLEVFACGTDGALWHDWQAAPSGGVVSRIEYEYDHQQLAETPGGGWPGWAGWAPLAPGSAITSDPAVARNADGRLEVFARGTDALWTLTQAAPGSSVWSGWTPIAPGSAITSDPVVGINADGRLEVFARSTDNALWHIRQTHPGGGWTGWASLGGRFTSDPAAARDVAVVARNADGRLEVFARGTDRALYHNWQTAPGDGWAGWAPIAPGSAIASDPVAGINADGRLEVFARGTDGALWHIWQDAPGSRGWTGWASLGGTFPGGTAAPFNVAVVARNAVGCLEVFARGTDSALWHNGQTAPGGGWSGWASLAPGSAIISDPAVGINADGRLEVFARGTDSALWHIWQTAPGGAWSGWAPLAPGITSDPAVGTNADGRLEVFARGTNSALWHISQTPPGIPGHLAAADPASPSYDPNYDYRGNITQITRYADAATSAGAIVESRRYDICGNLISRSGQPYDQMTYTYDLGTQYAYPSAVTWGAADPASPARMTRSFSYDSGTGVLLTSTDPNGRITQYASDPATLRLQQMTLPAGGYTLYSYADAAEQMQIDQNVWTADGNPAGQTTTLFNGLGLAASVLISGEYGFNAVSTQYDSMGRIWKRSQPCLWGSSPVWTVFSYDGLGRITSVQDPDESLWTWYYDEQPGPPGQNGIGETVRVQSPAVTWQGKTVNGADRLYRTDPLGFLAEVVQPDAYGTWPGGSVFDGNVRTYYSYNALGLPVQVTQGSQGQQRSFRYDSLGRLTAQYVPEKSMTLDDTGTYVGPGDTARWSDVFTYDDRSNLTSHTEARGVRTLYTYAANPTDPPDPLNRLWHVSYESLHGDPNIVPTAPIDYFYVGWGDVTRPLQVSTSPIASSQATRDYSYDAEGRLVSNQLSLSTSETALPALELDYAYDSLNRLTGVTYPAELGVAGRKNISYSYDPASGLLASVQIDGADYASGLTYNPAGQFTSITVGPAGPQQTVETYGYDPATGLLASQQIDGAGTTLLDLGYAYWPNGQLQGRTEVTGLRRFEYNYDAVDRLWQINLAWIPGRDWSQEYTFDEYGNRTAVTTRGIVPPDGLPSLTYDPQTNHVTTAGFAYDEAGNLTRGQRPDGSWQRYQYDQAGRLAAVTDDNGQPLESYGYGAGGTRLITTRAGNSTVCLWDRGKIVAEYAQVSGTELAWTRSRVYLGNRILASFMPAQPGQSGETVYYHHPDRLGTCLITNNADNTATEQATLPFGTLSPFSTPNPVNPIFTTYDRSPATGLDYAVNRNYDCGLGFTQPDPVVITNLRDPRSLNLYSYVRNDPVNRTDPAGLQDEGVVSNYGSFDPSGFLGLAAFLLGGLASYLQNPEPTSTRQPATAKPPGSATAGPHGTATDNARSLSAIADSSSPSPVKALGPGTTGGVWGPGDVSSPAGGESVWDMPPDDGEKIVLVVTNDQGQVIARKTAWDLYEETPLLDLLYGMLQRILLLGSGAKFEQEGSMQWGGAPRG